MNRRDRRTEYLSDNQVFEMVDTADEALALGCPLNRSITIHLERAGLAPLGARVALSNYLKRVGDWLQKVADTKAFYIYAFENKPSHGLHVHILLHVPKHRIKQFHARQRRWLEASGILWKKRVLRSRPVKGSDDIDPRRYLMHLRWAVGYLIKGSIPENWAGLGIKHEYQGDVLGKRAGCSQIRYRTRAKRSSSERKAFARAFLGGSIPVETSNWPGEARSATRAFVGAVQHKENHGTIIPTRALRSRDLIRNRHVSRFSSGPSLLNVTIAKSDRADHHEPVDS